MDPISKHIQYLEAIDSPTAEHKHIKNIPGQKELANMKEVANRCFEPLREHFGIPLHINSFYRSEELNKAIGGASNSQHLYGEAIDIAKVPGTEITNAKIFAWLVSNVDFDQCIWENGSDKEPDWVHISYSTIRNRKQILQMTIKDGKKHYTEIKI